jgi:hypothetical protein
MDSQTILNSYLDNLQLNPKQVAHHESEKSCSWAFYALTFVPDAPEGHKNTSLSTKAA